MNLSPRITIQKFRESHHGGFKLYTQRLWVTNSSFETETETHGVNEILEIAAPAVSEI